MVIAGTEGVASVCVGTIDAITVEVGCIDGVIGEGEFEGQGFTVTEGTDVIFIPVGTGLVVIPVGSGAEVGGGKVILPGI